MSIEPLFSQFADDLEMRELLEQFIAGFDKTTEELRHALQAGNADSVRRIGHQLKGAGGGYGYPEITAAGASLEQAVLREGTIDEVVRQSAESLVTLFDRAREGLPRV